MKNTTTNQIIPESLENFRKIYVSELTENLYNICLDIKERSKKATEGISPTSREYTYAISNFLQQLRNEGNLSLYNQFVFARTVRKEEIEAYAVKQSHILVQNLIKRVEKKVGTILDTSHLHVTFDNQGATILAGNVKGTEGFVTVKSVIAGGYNIQKLHVRVTVR